MAEEFIKITGVDELASCINKALEKCPDEMNKAMRKTNGGWKKDVNAKFPYSDYGSNAHSKIKRASGKADITKPFSKCWKSRTSYSQYGYIDDIETGNTHKLWHLVENGHHKWYMGHDTGGFVPGRHYKDSVNEKYETEYPESMGKAAKKALDEAGL